MAFGEIVAVIGAYPHTDALFAQPSELSSGEVVVFQPFASVPGGAGALFARQTRQIEGFDFAISELPVVNYLSAKEHGASLIALPVFVTRRFVQNLLIVDRDIVRHPKDLEGQRVGLPYFGHSDSTWLRGILAERYDVDLSRITWVTESEEQVARATLPGNVIHIPRTSVAEMLIQGEVVALMTTPAPWPNLAAGRDIGPMWPDGEATDEAWYRHSAIMPLLHTVVVQVRALDAVVDLARQVYSAFVGARDGAVAGVEAGQPVAAADLGRARSSGFPTTTFAGSDRPYLGPDPIPYGIEANRHALEALVRMARGAGVTASSPPVEDLFLPVG